MLRHTVSLALFALLTLVLGGGCSEKKGVSADPQQARDILKQGLEAWQKGEAQDAFKLRTNITMVERRWADGVTLVSFEIAADGEMNGFDWQTTVKTTIKGKDGKTTQEKAIYAISTAPNLVVVRSES